jgi:hypothetical protein
MNTQIIRVLIAAATILPFAALGYKLFVEETLLTAGVYTLIIVILFGTVFAASRVRQVDLAPKQTDHPQPVMPPPATEAKPDSHHGEAGQAAH